MFPVQYICNPVVVHTFLFILVDTIYRSVQELGHGRTLHLGDIPGYRRMQTFASPKSHVHVRQVERQVNDLRLGLMVHHLFLVG
jgi:hypothetical protein